MSVIQALSDMHREAVEQIRAGDHNAFLVGFLTTSTMLELSSLTNTDLRLDEYADAAAQTISQYAPLDRIQLTLAPEEFSPIVARVGFHDDDATALVHVARVEIDDVGVVELATASMPDPLAEAGFLDIAADHIASGLRVMLESERRRRRAAVADTLALVASLNEQWGQGELDALAQSIATLPGAHAAHLGVGANRLAGVLTADYGHLGGEVIERSFTIDERVQADVAIAYRVEPTSEQLELLDEILTTLAANLSRIEQNIRLTSEAETDQLTGVANRRRVGKSLAAARAMSDRRNEPFAVLLFDLDHFKSVNDRLGHAVGDQVLARFAEVLQANVRPFDTVARWGGEEFMLLCPDCGVPGAIAISQRVLEQCPRRFDDVLPPEIVQTTSVGIAVYPEHGRTPESVIHAADEALYRAKREGRNRWSAAGVPARV
ncbi:MAG: GGDEF domain-containing protein [Ilumatobacteraceae bacterium]|nr:GGDEF domain-containing protein [Acidimicrobiales bacterium]MCB9395601.1 GGDEF domain-containing protein [Acidimicrobiaceae bacterium]